MPRKSSAALSVVSPARPVPWLRPRDGMPKGVASIFADVVATMPADHFRASDATLLEAYAQAVSISRHAFQCLQDEGPVDAHGRMSAWVTVLEKQHRAIANVSMRLRLPPQARIRPGTVGRRSKSGITADEYLEMHE